MQRFDTDVFIAGGGPAGLAVAIAAASRGLAVTLADGCRPPLDKACGEGLLPNSLAALAALGVLLDHADTAPLHGIRFLSSSHFAEARFPCGAGRGVRRTLLHSLLLARAESLGVRFLWNTPVTTLHGECIASGSRQWRSRWIVGADGLQSRVRHWGGLDQSVTRSRRIGLRCHYRIAPWNHFVEIYWGDRGQAYVTPVGPEQVCVAFVACERFPSADAALAAFPALQARLAGAALSSSTRGSLTLGRRLKHVTRGHLALVGDASGSVDAITGEGLALGFRQAVRLADAFCAGDLSSYEVAHAAIARVPRFMSRTMLLMDRSRWVRNHTLQALERSPQLFARMLRVHVGAAPLHLLGSSGLLNLGWRLLTA